MKAEEVKMTRTQLNCFSAVLRTLSFTKASNLLYTSQPAISKNISKLEEELGCRLFERSGSSLTVTEAGWLLNDFLELSEREFQKTIEEIRRVSSNSGRTVKIGCPETWNPHFLYALLKELTAELPELRYSVESYRLSELLARLGSGTFDIIVTHEFYASSPLGPACYPVEETGCGLLYSVEQHPDVTSPEQLKDIPFLVYDDDISKLSKRFSGVIRDCCGDYGCRPRFRSMSQATTALFDTANGKGVMFFSDWDSAISNPVYGYLPLKRRLPVNLVYYPEKISAEAKQLLEAARARHPAAGRK